MKRIHILQIFNRYLQYGGEEGSVYRIGDALQKNHDVEYFLTSTADMFRQGLLADLTMPAKALYNPKIVRRLERYQNVGKFDLWQIHNVFPAMSPAVYQKAFEWGIPIVHYLHNYRMSCANGYFLNHGEACELCLHGNFMPALATACWRDSHLISGMMGMILSRTRQIGTFKKINAWVALCEAQKRQHVRMGIPEERIHVIPHFYEVKQEPLPMGDAHSALFLGRLSKEKGVDRLLQAWAKLDSGNGELLIMGEGPEKKNLQDMCENLNLRNVRFLGFVTPENQGEIWSQVGFIVVPSIWIDPLPSVVFEAWDRGRAVVVHKVGGLAETVDDGVNGLWADPEDTGSLAQKIGTLLGNPQLCSDLARAGREKIQKNYTADDWRTKISGLYNKILN